MVDRTLEDLLSTMRQDITHLQRRQMRDWTTDMGLAFGLGRRNLVRNARLLLNQRGAASGASLASLQFFLDGWASNAAANAVTWTGDGNVGRVLTIPSGKSIYQVVEQRTVIPGNYVLTWEGTAALSVYKLGDFASPTAAPFTATFDGTGHLIILATAGTLSNIALVRAEEYSGFFPDLGYAEELAWNKLFFQAFAANEVEVHNQYDGVALGAGTQFIRLPLVEMRATPLVKTNANVVPTNNLFSFLYFSRTAAAATVRNVGVTATTPKRLSGLYSSTHNSGNTLSTNFVLGLNTTDIWLDAEI